MSDFRSIKKAARARLHGLMRAPAIYVAPNGTQTPVGVRLHTSTRAFGELSGGGSGFAQEQVAVPTAIFWLDEGVTPVRDGIISVSVSEAYKVEYVHPQDDVTVKAQITELSAPQRAGLPVPA